MQGKPFIYILIFTLITVVAWVVFDINHSQTKIIPPPEIEQLLEPINPNFDKEVTDALGD